MIFETKNDVELEDLKMLQPALWILLSRTFLYCQEYKLPCKITSLISDRANVSAKSMTHQDGRACDVSVKGWTEQHIQRFVFLMNRDYADIAAISASDNKPRAVVYHDAGYGAHLHIQVKRNARYERFIK